MNEHTTAARPGTYLAHDLAVRSVRIPQPGHCELDVDARIELVALTEHTVTARSLGMTWHGSTLLLDVPAPNALATAFADDTTRLFGVTAFEVG